MKKAVFLLSLALAVSVMASPVPKEVKAAYGQLKAAMQKRDAAAFGKLVDSSFVLINDDGTKTTRKEFMETITGIFKSAAKVEPVVKFTGSHSHHDMVDVMFDFTCTITTKEGKSTLHEIGTDTWKKVKGKWVMVKTVDKSYTVKGPLSKPMPKIGKD